MSAIVLTADGSLATVRPTYLPTYPQEPPSDTHLPLRQARLPSGCVQRPDPVYVSPSLEGFGSRPGKGHAMTDPHLKKGGVPVARSLLARRLGPYKPWFARSRFNVAVRIGFTSRLLPDAITARLWTGSLSVGRGSYRPLRSPEPSNKRRKVWGIMVSLAVKVRLYRVTSS